VAPSLGLLVVPSRFLPRFLGVWLALAGFAWVILSLTGVLLPQYQDKVRNAKTAYTRYKPIQRKQRKQWKITPACCLLLYVLPSVSDKTRT